MSSIYKNPFPRGFTPWNTPGLRHEPIPDGDYSTSIDPSAFYILKLNLGWKTDISETALINAWVLQDLVSIIPFWYHILPKVRQPLTKDATWYIEVTKAISCRASYYITSLTGGMGISYASTSSSCSPRKWCHTYNI